MEEYPVLTLSGIVFVLKIVLAKKYIFEMKLLNKYSLETKSNIE